jgi:Fur family peroxide stress response transcriptional regulator
MDKYIAEHQSNQAGSSVNLGTFRQKCRENGLKLTPQRTAVYQVLMRSMDHPSAEVVYHRVREKLPNISLDTVNRTLIMLHEIGVASTVEGSGDAKRFDGNLDDHQHFKCLKCKRIVDIYCESLDAIAVPAGLEDHTVLRKTVYFEGICKSCAHKQ